MALFALTLSEAAEEAAIPRSVLEASIVLGRGPKARRIGKRTTIILREDFDAWLRSLPETRLLSDEEASHEQ